MALPSGGGANVPGLLQLGNIDTLHRPVVRNPKGGISTVLSVSYGGPQGEVLIPSVIKKQGRWQIVKGPEAYRHYLKTGQHLGIFDTAANANAYGVALHGSQAQQFAPPLTAGLIKAGKI